MGTPTGKILVVDDERDVQMLFEMSFSEEMKSGRIAFHFAYSGEEALHYLEKQGTESIAKIFSDINMPGMNGIELLKRIKERYRHLKVFMITAYGDKQNFEEAKKNGCEDYFTKPLDFDALKQQVLGAA